MSNNNKLDILKKIKSLIRYYDLGYVLNNIESLIYLPIPIKNKKIGKEQFKHNQKIAHKVENSAKLGYYELTNEHELRKNTFESIRKHYPNFCRGIKKHLSDEEYQEYLYLLKNCSNSIESIVNSFSTRKCNNYNKLLLHKKDSISYIVDSEKFSKLTYMQDDFVLSELADIDYSRFDPKTQENIDKLKSDLNTRLSNYKFFQKLYASKNIVRLKTIKNSRTEER